MALHLHSNNCCIISLVEIPVFGTHCDQCKIVFFLLLVGTFPHRFSRDWKGSKREKEQNKFRCQATFTVYIYDVKLNAHKHKLQRLKIVLCTHLEIVYLTSHSLPFTLYLSPSPAIYRVVFVQLANESCSLKARMTLIFEFCVSRAPQSINGNSNVSFETYTYLCSLETSKDPRIEFKIQWEYFRQHSYLLV